MLKINKNQGLTIVGKDDTYYYGFLPNRKEMKIFSPILYLIFRLYKIEYKKIRKYFQPKEAQKSSKEKVQVI
jgi:hypothetical protein